MLQKKQATENLEDNEVLLTSTPTLAITNEEQGGQDLADNFLPLEQVFQGHSWLKWVHFGPECTAPIC